MPNTFQRNFAALSRLFPGFATARTFYTKLESGGFMPLSLERIDCGEALPRFSLMHTYTQNGDLMRDPDVEFVVDGDSVFAVSYRQDGLGIFREFEPRSRRAADTDRFLSMWLRNLKAQGFKPINPDGAPKAIHFRKNTHIPY